MSQIKEIVDFYRLKAEEIELNKLQLEFLLRILRLLTGFGAFWCLFWGIIFEAVKWEKTWDQALISSLLNWFLFMMFLIATASINMLLAHPEVLERKPKAKVPKEKEKPEKKETPKQPLW